MVRLTPSGLLPLRRSQRVSFDRVSSRRGRFKGLSRPPPSPSPSGVLRGSALIGSIRTDLVGVRCGNILHFWQRSARNLKPGKTATPSPDVLPQSVRLINGELSYLLLYWGPTQALRFLIWRPFNPLFWLDYDYQSAMESAWRLRQPCCRSFYYTV